MGRAAGVMNGIGNVASFLAPAMVGVMIGKTGNFSVVIVFLSAVLLVAAIALALLIRSRY
jgi:ACS family glucarate transporter-like MFS transporter